jgi:uroporphyrinogen decarboxylase
MDHRTRFERAMTRQSLDRPPIDFIAQGEVPARLVRYLGVRDYEDALVRLDVDFRHFSHADYRAPHEKDERGFFTDMWGVRRRPVVNQFGSYDEVEYRPFASIRSMDEVKAYPWPSPDIFDFAGLEAACDRVRGEYIVIFGHPGLMDLINGTSFGRGMEQVLVDVALRDPVGLALMEKRQEILLEVVERALKAAKGKIDVLWIGDDYGIQTGQLMNLETWKEVFAPKMKAFIDLGHRYGAKVMLHSCGSNRALIPLWIDMGLDIYQAVQVEAEGMDAAGLFRDFGKHIAFHGMIGLQSVMAHGSVADVRHETERIVRLSEGSSYIVAPTHFLEIDIPMENAVAIYDIAKEFASS